MQDKGLRTYHTTVERVAGITLGYTCILKHFLDEL